MATPMNSAQFKDIVEPLLNKVFDGLYKQTEDEWTPIFKVEQGIQRRFQEDVVLAGFGVAQEKPEGTPFVYDNGGQAYTVPYVHKTYGLAFALTEELMEDGDHISIGRTYSEQLARSMKESKEIVHANILNRAFSNSFAGGDGVSLLNTAHPLFQGGTFSNKLSVAAQLSEASVEQLLIQIRNAVDERNKKISLKGRRLIVPPSLMFTAERILRSTLRSGTGNNDINAMKNMGMLPDGIHVMSRLTSATAYYIQTDALRGLMHYTRSAVRRGMEGDFETSSMRYKSRERYAAGWTDPRGLYGSEGQ